MTRAARESADDEVVRRYAETLDSPRDLRALRDFVRHVRTDLGPEAEILAAAIGDDGTLIVWFRRPGEPATTSTGTSAPPESHDVAPGRTFMADRSQSAASVSVPVAGRRPASSGRPAGSVQGADGSPTAPGGAVG
jgi:hypothetical protein